MEALKPVVKSRAEMAPISLAGIELAREPFLHASVLDCLKPAVGEALLDWFETTAPWKLVETDFYEQWEFSLWDTPSSPAIILTGEAAIEQIRRSIEQIYKREFNPRVDIVAHKLVQGQHIGIHNDFLEGAETHRLTLQLNRGLSDEEGGLFILFNSSDPSDIFQILRPVHLSGVTFEISGNSYHAVSRQYGGERYTLVFSFYAKP